MIVIRTMKSTTLSLACLALLAGCDPQVDPQYRGEPLGTLRGTVDGASTSKSEGAEVGVLWFSSTEDAECTGPELTCGLAGGGGPQTDTACVEACGPIPEECNADLLEPYKQCVESCGGVFDYSVDWSLCVNAGIGATVPVSGTFPSMFKLDLFNPPPAAAMVASQDGGPAVALGWILVVNEDAPQSYDFENPDPSWEGNGVPGILGALETHMLMYTAEPVPADSGWGMILGGAYEPGYHLVSVIHGAEECVEWGPDGEESCYQHPDTLQPEPADLDAPLTIELESFFEIDFPGAGL